MTCVEKIMGQELKLNPNAIVGIVRNALRNATQQHQVNVRVNPADVEMLRKNERKLLDVLARANTIEIREDEEVARGGCIVMTELGTIDASLAQQIEAIKSIIDDEMLNGDPNAELMDPAGFEEEEDYEDAY